MFAGQSVQEAGMAALSKPAAMAIERLKSSLARSANLLIETPDPSWP